MTAKRKSSSKFNKKSVFKIIGKIFLWFFGISIVWVLAFRFINPPITLLMVLRKFDADTKSKSISKEWISYEDMAKSIKIAAVAGEDEKFFNHFGFDIDAIEQASKDNAKGKKIKGASTITQQTAKNVFLWPGRSWVRKGFEAYFTVLIELLWSKERILEVYLNVIEMGDGIYGAEAASKRYFKKSASKITRSEAALLVACFPNPIRWTPKKPTSYIYRKQSIILRKMRTVKLPKQ